MDVFVERTEENRSEFDRVGRVWHIDRLKQDIVQARSTDTALAAERARLALRVRLLNPGSLDPDLLEERAHAVLGYGRGDEVMILLPEARASQR